MKTFNQKLTEGEMMKAIPKTDVEHIAKDPDLISTWSDSMLLDAMRVIVEQIDEYQINELCRQLRMNSIDEIGRRLAVKRKPMRAAEKWAEFFCKPEDSDVMKQTVIQWIERIQDDALNRNAPPLQPPNPERR